MIPLVLVHGFLGGSAHWTGQVEDLSDLCDIVTVDLPGFGANAHLTPIASIGGMADWVLSELSRQDVHKFHLLGHSMGGMIVQEMVARASDRIETLILYATSSLGVLPGRFETIAQSKARARADGPASTAKRIAATWFKDRENATKYPSCAEIACKASAAAIDAGLDAMEVWTGEATLPDISVRCLIIWGDCDRTYKWDQIERLWVDIPTTSIAVVPECAHAVHLEKPELFNMHLRDWLSRTA